MKKYCLFLSFILMSNFVLFVVSAQAPDLLKIHGNKEKISAWLAYCQSLRYGGKSSTNNYVNLKLAAMVGLKLAGANDAENRSQFLFYAGIGSYYQVKFDSAQYYFYQSLAEAQKANLAKLITNNCVALIPVNFQLRQQEKVDSCKNILQTILDTTHDKSIQQDGYYAMGVYYQEKSYYSTAEDYFLKSIELRKTQVDTTHDNKLKADYAIQCFMLSKQYQNTVVLYAKSLSILREGEPFARAAPPVFIRYLSAFTEIYSLLGNIDSALHFEDLLEKATKNSPAVPSEMVSANLNIAKYYIEHSQLTKAFSYITKVNRLAAESKSPILIYQAQLWMGRYLEKDGKFKDAIATLAQSLPVAKQISKEQYAEGLNYMAIAQNGAGNLKASIGFYNQYVTQSDSLTNEKISRNFADQETRYETNKKESRIISLDKENRLNGLELQSASHLRVLLILCLVAVGIIALLLYFIYRNKAKANVILNNQKVELENLNEQLGTANETKAKLFSIIGHDLRAPLGQIVQLLRLQKENPDLLSADVKQRYQEKLRSASESVLETMEDLLLWSKSQMQNFTPNKMPIYISAIVQKEIDLLYQRSEEKNIRLNNLVPANLLQYTDENFTVIIIRNLLQNAIKYGDKNSEVLITADNKNINITNQNVNVNVEKMNELLHNKTINSKASGLGLQIVNDLAIAIHAKVIFEQKNSKTITAILCWDV